MQSLAHCGSRAVQALWHRARRLWQARPQASSGCCAPRAAVRAFGARGGALPEAAPTKTSSEATVKAAREASDVVLFMVFAPCMACLSCFVESWFEALVSNAET